MTVMKVVCKIPLSGAKKKAAASKADKHVVVAQETEDSGGPLGTTLSEIDRLIVDVKETDDAATPKILTWKMKNIGENSSEIKIFDLRHLGGQELTEEDISELKKFAIAGDYQPGSILFGGVDEEILGCIPDRAGAKIVNNLIKCIGFLKLESILSSYRKQHIIGSLVYSIFKVQTSLLFSNSLLFPNLRHAKSYITSVLW
jgi:hypothetical protein